MQGEKPGANKCVFKNECAFKSDMCLKTSFSSIISIINSVITITKLITHFWGAKTHNNQPLLDFL